MSEHLIGRPVLRKEGVAKVTGQAKYVDDLHLPGMLYGATVRNPAGRGRIRDIAFDPGVPWEEFTVVTAADIPGENYVALILHDQPFLAKGVVNHAEEPVVLIAHPDRYLVEEARRRVHITVDPLPQVFSIAKSLETDKKENIIWGEQNLFKMFHVERGDVNQAFHRAALIVEGEYETGAQEQLYIETNGMLAVANPKDGVTVWGSMQCPYYIHKALLPLFGLPHEKVRVVQCETGGGFGGKEEYPSMIAGHAALLAWKSGKPVKLIYDRAEDMVATTKRHPSRTRHRTAVARDGKLFAMEIEFNIDGGAYCTLSPVVLSRGTIHAAGPYNCPNVRIRSRALATNFPPHGAFRGFGAPQSIFALERHMNKVAAAVGLAPDEFRRRNFLHEGEQTATGQVIRERLNLQGLLARALDLSGYCAKRTQFDKSNSGSPVKQGVGFATFMHGAGFTGSGEVALKSVVTVEATRAGHVRILTASTEIGQGTNTIFSQIAAEALDLPYDQIELAQPDTAEVPNSGPTVASRTVMVVGKLVEAACVSLKQLVGAKNGDFAAAAARYFEQFGKVARASSEYQPPPGAGWNDETYQGDAYGAYAWAVYVATVSVDTRTYETRVDDFVALQEIGKVIHPVLAAGQIEGGVAQAIGFALYENCVWKDGRMANAQMTNYIMPTSADLPPIRVFFEENPYAYGPAGAKGIGELPMDGVAPAILNAVEHATGVSVNRIPMTPEILMQAMLEEKHG
ncbi:MAG TPA: xanthine dehydrogenase family protein molybdopterin-binding subunit [Bryobacteraceae bacterium]|nr:xanthine dehydrogenase family protein molybdopterin-binding subunit [Bryobacteraceae bacterium]